MFCDHTCCENHKVPFFIRDPLRQHLIRASPMRSSYRAPSLSRLPEALHFSVSALRVGKLGRSFRDPLPQLFRRAHGQLPGSEGAHGQGDSEKLRERGSSAKTGAKKSALKNTCARHAGKKD